MRYEKTKYVYDLEVPRIEVLVTLCRQMGETQMEVTCSTCVQTVISHVLSRQECCLVMFSFSHVEVSKLTEGLLALYQPELKKVKQQLDELT